MKRLFAAMAAMMLVPTIPAVCCAESYQNIETLREQSPKKVVFDCINDRSTGLGIPAALAEEIIKRGTVLPKNDIFLSKR